MFFNKSDGYALYIKVEVNNSVYYVLDIIDSSSLDTYLANNNLSKTKVEVLAFSHSENAYNHVNTLSKFLYKNDIRVLRNNIPSSLSELKGVYSKDVLGLDHELYNEESKIIAEHHGNSLGGCLIISLILIGLVGIPLGGWGIPILIIAGFWWFSETNKEMNSKIENNGITRRPVLPDKYHKILEALFLDFEKHLK